MKLHYNTRSGFSLHVLERRLVANIVKYKIISERLLEGIRRNVSLLFLFLVFP